MKILVAAMILCASASANAQRIGDWLVSADTDSSRAVTTNDSGNILGQFCYSDSGECIWLIGLTIKCEKGARYSVLANTDSHARPLEVVCQGPISDGTVFAYYFAAFDEADKMVRGNTRIGIAFPLAGDAFRVIRFDIAGGAGAIKTMLSIVPARKRTRDERL